MAIPCVALRLIALHQPMYSPVIAKNKLIPDMAFKCDDIIRRAHVSRSKREQQATATEKEIADGLLRLP